MALLFIVLDMVELLADFSIPPDANDVFEDEMEIGNCCGRNGIGFLSDLLNIRVYSIKCNYNSEGYYVKFGNLHIFGSYSYKCIKP